MALGRPALPAAPTARQIDRLLRGSLGWITFQMRCEEDLRHAVWLMRLSYLRYALKTSTEPQKLLEQESEELHLNPRFKLLLEPFVTRARRHMLRESVA